MTELILVGDEALSPAEFAARDRQRAYCRARWANDPVYRAKRLAYMRAWKIRHHRGLGREVYPIRVVASLHDLRCTGPTRTTGCVCSKTVLYERVAT